MNKPRRSFRHLKAMFHFVIAVLTLSSSNCLDNPSPAISTANYTFDGSVISITSPQSVVSVAGDNNMIYLLASVESLNMSGTGNTLIADRYFFMNRLSVSGDRNVFYLWFLPKDTTLSGSGNTIIGNRNDNVQAITSSFDGQDTIINAVFLKEGTIQSNAVFGNMTIKGYASRFKVERGAKISKIVVTGIRDTILIPKDSVYNISVTGSQSTQSTY